MVVQRLSSFLTPKILL